jgi:hypothetical protein
MAFSLMIATIVMVEPFATVSRAQRPISPTFPTPAPIAAGSQCLHGPNEAAEQAGRRRQALAVARAINTAQMRQRPAMGEFLDRAAVLRLPALVNLGATQTGEVAPGWSLQLAASADAYVFAIKDTTDPCQFAFFSDNSGLIYTAQPIQ